MSESEVQFPKLYFSQKRIQSQNHKVLKHYEECEQFLIYAFNEDNAVTQSQMPRGAFPGEEGSPQLSSQMRSEHSSSAEEEQASFGDIDFQPSGSLQGSSSSASGSKSPSYNFNEVENRIYQDSKH